MYEATVIGILHFLEHGQFIVTVFIVDVYILYMQKKHLSEHKTNDSKCWTTVPCKSSLIKLVYISKKSRSKQKTFLAPNIMEKLFECIYILQEKRLDEINI